eukprot:COSAG04_NODE_2103_length_4779_cov_3.468162_5_plen_176_part_00
MALAFVDVSELNVGDNTVIIGHREAVMALLTASPAQRLEAALGTDILPGLASTLTPGTDDGVSAETFVGGGSGSLRRVAIVMLPTACSRHNSPSHGHAITKLLRGCSGSGALSIIMPLSDPSHCSASACAVARAFPTYSLKSDASAVPDVTAALIGATPADLERANLAAAGVRRF